MSPRRVLVAGIDFHGYKERIAKAWRELGWEAGTLDVYYPHFDRRLLSRLKYSILPGRLGVRSFLDQAWARSRNHFLNQAKQQEFDLLLVTTPDFLTPHEMSALRDAHPKATFACWVWDPLDRFPAIVPVLPLFDHVFVYDAGDLERGRKLNPSTHELLLAFSPEDFYPATTFLEPPKWKISFVGFLTQDRLRLLERVCRDLTFTREDVQFFAGAWRVWPLVGKRRLHQQSWLYRKDMVRLQTIDAPGARSLYHHSAICLNAHQAGCQQGYNMRLFEIAGAGGFQMTERLPGIERVFTDGKEIVLYDSAPDLVEKMRYYLAHPEEAGAIAKAAAHAAHQQHTFVHRMRKVQEICGY